MQKEFISPKKRDDWQEVQNYIEAINVAITDLQTLPLSNRFLVDKKLLHWVTFFLTAVIETATSSHETFMKIMTLLGEVEHRCSCSFTRIQSLP